jgi:signal transduction histidine kinase
LDGAYISALHVDDAHRLWAATSDRGLFVIQDPESPAAQVRNIDSTHGLPGNQISAMVPDDEGGLWVSTDKGLARVDMQSLQVRMLGAADGVSIQDYWAFAAARSASGEVYFGGEGGLTVIRPQRLLPRPVPRSPVMTALQVDGRNMPVTAVAGRDSPGTLVLPLDYREAAIEFSALELGHGARMRYGHRLETVHADWIETDATRRYVVLPRLSPGEHRLQVRAGEPGGPWSQPLELVVRVQPFWYERSWARALFAMAVVAAVAALVQLRTHWLRRRQRVLELAVAERTAALDASQHALRKLGEHNALALEEERKHVSRELHDEMGQQLAALRMEVSVMGMRTRASQLPQPEQFDMLLGRVDHLVRSVRGLVSQLRPPALDGGLAAALEWLADEFRRSTSIACELEIDRTVCELSPRQATMVFRIAQESLTNVRRHANASRVTLQLQRDPPGVVLSVRDNGAGFDTAARRHGHGLLGMQERARLLRGELTVTSVPGSGTTVVLRTEP